MFLLPSSGNKERYHGQHSERLHLAVERFIEAYGTSLAGAKVSPEDRNRSLSVVKKEPIILQTSKTVNGILQHLSQAEASIDAVADSSPCSSASRPQMLKATRVDPSPPRSAHVLTAVSTSLDGIIEEMELRLLQQSS